jgi:putative peptidoglycan lipid II flippase
VRVLYQHRRGEFGPEDTGQVALALAAYAVGLAGYALVKLLVPTFYAIGRTWYPVLVAAITIGVKVLLNVVLAFGVPWLGIAGLGFHGLALATGLAAWLNAMLLFVALRREVGPSVGRGVGGTSVKVVAVSALMGVTVWQVHGWLETLLPTERLWGAAVALGLVVALGLLVSLGGLMLAGVDEVREAIRRLVRRKR